MSMELLVQQFGKFHLVVLHFPVVLILLAPPVMAWSLRRGQEWWRKTIPHRGHLAAIATIGTTILGLLLAAKLGPLDGALSLHRAMGIATSVLITITSGSRFPVCAAGPPARGRGPAGRPRGRSRG